MSLSAAGTSRMPVAVRSAMVLFILILALLWFRHNFLYGLDDSYITFRYAQNFAIGEGLCFNPGEKHFGSTAMGFALVLGTLSCVVDDLTDASLRIAGQLAVCGVSIPLLANALCALALGLVVWILYRIGERLTGIFVGALTAMLFAFLLFPAPYLNSVSGHETLVYLALILLAFDLIYFAGRPVASAFTLAVATTVRPDAFLAFVIAGLFLGIQTFVSGKGKRLLTLYMLCYLGLVALWLLFCRLHFGTWIPATLQAKQAQILLGYWEPYSIALLVRDTFVTFGHPATVLMLLLPMISTLLAMLWKRTPRVIIETPALLVMLSLLAFACGQALFYALIGVTNWWWYETPFFLFLFLSAAVSICFLFGLFSPRWAGRIPAAGVLVLLLALLHGHGASVAALDDWARRRSVNPHVYAYDPIVEYLKAVEPSGCTVAMAEPGAAGFKLGPAYKVVDLLGLASPEVAERIILGDMDYPYNQWAPEYAIASWNGSYSPTSREWFKERYALVGEFKHPFWVERLSRGAYLYRKRP